MRVAVTSLPVTLSPVMRTVLSLLPMTRRNSNTARIRALLPTTTESIASGACCVVMADSYEPERLEFRHAFTQGGLDAEIQRHVRAGAAGAHAGQAYVGGVADHFNQLDVAAVGAKKWPHALEDGFHTFLCHHGEP